MKMCLLRLWFPLAMAMLVAASSSMGCEYCASTSDVCVGYQNTCVSYQQFCTSYEESCTAYDDNGNCIAYDEQCVSYDTECTSYQQECTTYQSQCNSYSYGEYVTVTGTAASSATGASISGSTITLQDSQGDTGQASTDANGAYSITFFAYDNPDSTIHFNVCAAANQLYPAQCQSQTIVDNCSDPQLGANFSRTPVYPATQFVAGLYNDVLSRNPSGSEVQGWVDGLQGFSRYSAALGFLKSGEYRADLVSADYTKFLGRGVDASGLGYWTGQLAAGGLDEQVVIALTASAEYYADAGNTAQGFVARIYHDVLGRAASQSEINSLVALLHQGVSRTSLATSVVNSTEHRVALLNGWYQLYLGRPADSSGLAYWPQAMANGITDEVVQANLLGSDEFTKREAAAYGVKALPITRAFTKGVLRASSRASTLPPNYKRKLVVKPH